jgi:hypothetical protein
MGTFAEGLTHTKFKLCLLQHSASLHERTTKRIAWTYSSVRLLCRQEKYGGLTNHLTYTNRSNL